MNEITLTSRQHKLMDFLSTHCVGAENAMEAPDILVHLLKEYFPNGITEHDILHSRNIAYRRGLVKDIQVLRQTKLRMRLICSDRYRGYYLPKNAEEAIENLQKRATQIKKSLALVNSEIKQLKKNGFSRITFGPYEKDTYQTVSSDLIQNQGGEKDERQ